MNAETNVDLNAATLQAYRSLRLSMNKRSAKQVHVRMAAEESFTACPGLLQASECPRGQALLASSALSREPLL